MPPKGYPRTTIPARHPVVAETIKGWRNQAPAPHRWTRSPPEALARIRETARLPRRVRGGRMESAEAAQARGAIDLAIVGVMSDGGLRRSEAAALTWGATSSSGRTAQPASPSGRARTSRSRRPWRSPRPPPARCARFSPNDADSHGSGVRPDRRDAGQPDTCRRQGRRPGRRFLRDTAAASAWPEGWWRRERRTQRSRTRGGGSTGTWSPGTPGERPQGRP